MSISTPFRATGSPRWAALVAAALVVGCAGSSTSATAAKLGECANPNESKAPVDKRNPDENLDVAHDARQPETCTFQATDPTSKTVGPHAPMPKAPEDLHVVVVMLENRSFDHYLSGVADTEYSTSSRDPDPLDPRGYVTQEVAGDFCLEDTNHEWGAAHLEYDNGLMDGFVAVNNPIAVNGSVPASKRGKRVMTYYTKDDLPFMHWLAENFAIGDYHFSSLLGPTWPNRLFLFKATSCGYTLGGLDGNGGIVTDCSAKGPNLLRALDERGISHKLYDESGLMSITAFMLLDELHGLGEFAEDLDNDALPAFSMVGASNGQQREKLKLGPPQDDDHPAADVRKGKIFLYDVLSTLFKHPKTFEKTIVFVTYDENGGLYDHVQPPRACEPVRSTDSTERYDYKFDHYGFRVPLFVISPFVKRPGYVSHHITDHASIARFVEHVWGLGAMTARDANAWPMLDYFDFEHPLPQIDLPTTRPSASGGCARPTP